VSDVREYNADVIVIGSGVAGLSAALAVAEAGGTVAILTAGEVMAGSSPRAQGGVAAVVGADDSVALHVADTLSVGAGLNDRAAVQVLVEEGAKIVRRLLDGGVPFDGGAAHPELGLEAGHSRRRILHTGGATGWALTAALTDRALAHPNITLHAGAGADALSGGPEGVTGVVAGDAAFRARGVVIATGGYAGLWARTTNAPESRGSGVALAWQAGATLADLEFVQFHPTAIDLAGRPAYLLTEALRGEGGRVVDEREAPIVDPLLPRDVVARASPRPRAGVPVAASPRRGLHSGPVREHRGATG
jgi:L-aspartate oxidase